MKSEMVHQTTSSAFVARRRRRRAAHHHHHFHAENDVDEDVDDNDNSDDDDDHYVLPRITRNFTSTGAVLPSPRRLSALKRKRRSLLLNVLGLSVVLTLLLGLGMMLHGDFLDANMGRNARVLQPDEEDALQMTMNIGLKGTPLSQVPRETFDYFSPFLMADDEVDNDILFPSSSLPILHFVHTRFMQEQANLTALGEARLNLFEIFCLPTMASQSSENFFWLIRVDPDLDASVFQRLLDVVYDSQNSQRVDNIYLVASNNNFRINQDFQGAWRDGAQTEDLMNSRIYSGDAVRLSMALNVLDDYMILDTRLDADDGLHIDYLQTLQQLTLEEWAYKENGQIGNHHTRWKYWCAGTHLEWHWAKPHELPPVVVADDKRASKIMASKFGSLTVSTDSSQCITPGITVAFPPGAQESDVPVFPHNELAYRISNLPAEQSCGADSCLEFVQVHLVEAIRSRTPTSAGMLRILHDTPDSADDDRLPPPPSWQMKYAMWDMCHKLFSISRVRVAWVQSYLTRHLYEIGLDNLHGQCTTGHSCKKGAKADLERLIEISAGHRN